MIVGTAGHIDHGKTTLTHALTGVDTSRLKEEKERGITIELGYAYVPLAGSGGDEILGIIDVPGHEKFIRTMAAGITGIDFALLVIAADDGIMPQTLEHLAILQLLGVTRGAVALTKIDRADEARLLQVESAIGTLLADTAFAAAPIFRTNATVGDDAGVAALLACLAQAARQLPARDERRLFRLGVDRVFSLPGQGTIVTGTALAGRVNAGDTLQLAPGGELVRVRSIHAQNRAAESGLAGQRLALNLSGAARENIARGSWVVAPALALCSERVDAELTLARNSGLGFGGIGGIGNLDGLTLKPWSQVHVHLGPAHHTAHVVPLDSDVLQPGQSARVQLVFDAPLHAVPGDRFVVRNAQASLTIGGGVVLDPFGPARKRRSAGRRAWLNALADFIASGEYGALLAQSPIGMRLSTLVRLSQLPPAEMALPADALQIPLHGNDALLISQASAQALEQRIMDALAQFHAQAPDEAGPELWRLKRIVEPDMEDLLWSKLIAALLEKKWVLQRGRSLHLPGHTVELRADEQALAETLLAALQEGRFDPPWVRELARQYLLPETTVRNLLLKLAKSGLISQVVPDLFYHPAGLAELAQLFVTLGTASGSAVSAAAFRDASGLGRKRAIQLLEFFDRVGYTRRFGNAHLLRPNAQWT
jgi:selenocysteine-specific elongation factor